jgi:hypothetical protein
VNIKYTYLRDTPPPQPVPPKLDKKGNVIKVLSPRVVSIARAVDNDLVHFAAIVNKVVDKRETDLPQRLRQIMEPQAFKELQKKYRRRYGGDVHCRKAAQNILKGLMYSKRAWTRRTHRTFTIRYRDGHVVEDILEFLATGGAPEDNIPVVISNVCYKALHEMREKRQQLAQQEGEEFKRLVGAERKG